ncbi:uncharacterized protein ASCRUDRAFT_75974 [Ascoidea rubescens DSM 1968]|uniref:Uncharacterized protein n=1 Tax=Ascoidea rubescens DSM 1968 TaxID=1344418 RepID=A0A1D2VHZ6_9ASCO|nr:hypothetical protein ASCRUDRAFT_75974 [Ascoidea rubescens DSM 1968]ODV61284.1 hypothetical protein ASCRUDRAFT_75974 [Ascoidea rubescens DSM 1968]
MTGTRHRGCSCLDSRAKVQPAPKLNTGFGLSDHRCGCMRRLRKRATSAFPEPRAVVRYLCAVRCVLCAICVRLRLFPVFGMDC